MLIDQHVLLPCSSNLLTLFKSTMAHPVGEKLKLVDCVPFEIASGSHEFLSGPTHLFSSPGDSSSVVSMSMAGTDGVLGMTGGILIQFRHLQLMCWIISPYVVANSIYSVSVNTDLSSFRIYMSSYHKSCEPPIKRCIWIASTRIADNAYMGCFASVEFFGEQ